MDIPINAAQLQKIRPYSRHAWVRGRAFLKPLRQELVHTPANEIDNLELKIRKCIELSTVFAKPVFTDRLAKRLIHKFGYSRVRAPLIQSMAHQKRFEDAAAWADKLAQEHPDDPWALYDAGICAMLVGNAPKALSIFRQILQMEGDVRGVPLETLCHYLLEAGDIDWLVQSGPAFANDNSYVKRAKSFQPASRTMPIYCISLEQDRNRMAATATFLEDGGELRRVHAVLGAALPSSVRSHMTSGDVTQISDAELGCCLSHLATWERVSAECDDDEFALITEDDSRFIYGPGVGLPEIETLAREVGAGLVFVNLGACYETSRAMGDDKMELFRLQDLMTGRVADTVFKNPGWGAYGYMLNGRTARELVEALHKFKILGVIDWQMFVMCLQDLPMWLGHRLTRNIYQVLKTCENRPTINGYVTNVPIITHRDYGYSSINSLATE